MDTDYLTMKALAVGGIMQVIEFGPRILQFPIGDLPEREWDLCVRVDPEDDRAVYEVCEPFIPDIFVPVDEKDYWLKSDPQQYGLPDDAWNMRADFLRMKSDCEGALAFLEQWGRWDTANYVDPREMFGLKKVIQKALEEPPNRWFGSTRAIPDLMNYRTPEFRNYSVRTNNCKEALQMTVTIDLLKKLKIKFCALPRVRSLI